MGTSITPALIAKRTWSEIGAQRFSGICQSPRKLSIKSATPIIRHKKTHSAFAKVGE